MRKKTKLIQGWGINDVEYAVTRYEIINSKEKIVWICPYYRDWVNILERCLSETFHENNPTYKDCTVCEEWKYLSNFIKWVDSQPNMDWENCQSDKDFLIEGNKHYSPETCVYVPRSLNLFITNRAKSRGSCMLGVRVIPRNKVKPYQARCNDPFTGKRDYLGLFPTELEAHLAWKAKKHEHACALADLQQDERIAERLREMYSSDKDLTKI